MTKKIAITASLTALLIVAGVLVGYSVTGADPAPDNAGGTGAPVASAPAEAAETETPAPAETEPVAPVVGATLTAEQVAALEDGWHAYPMADGSLVATQEGQPLPAAVVADLAAPVVAATASLAGTPDLGAVAQAAAKEQASKTIRETGMYAVVVYKTYDARGVAYQLPGGAAIDPAPRDLATAIAGAEAYIAGQSNAASWIVVNATGE